MRIRSTWCREGRHKSDKFAIVPLPTWYTRRQDGVLKSGLCRRFTTGFIHIRNWASVGVEGAGADDYYPYQSPLGHPLLDPLPIDSAETVVVSIDEVEV